MAKYAMNQGGTTDMYIFVLDRLRMSVRDFFILIRNSEFAETHYELRIIKAEVLYEFFTRI